MRKPRRRRLVSENVAAGVDRRAGPPKSVRGTSTRRKIAIGAQEHGKKLNAAATFFRKFMYSETKFPSPSGKYAFQISAWEARMSHWVESPRLFETGTEKNVWNPSDASWSLDSAEWTGENTVRVRIRHYPGDHTPSSFEVTIDCEQRSAEVGRENSIPVNSLDSALKELYARHQHPG